MAKLKELTLGSITLNSCDADPSIDSFEARKGSFAFDETSGCAYIKWGDNDPEWQRVNSNFAAFTSAVIDFKSTGSTILGTTRNNGSERFYLQAATAVLTSVSGFATVPTISVGTNPSSYNDMCTAQALTSLSTQNTFRLLASLVPQPALAGGTDIYVNVTGGASATNYDGIIIVRGFYA